MKRWANMLGLSALVLLCGCGGRDTKEQPEQQAEEQEGQRHLRHRPAQTLKAIGNSV